MSWLDIVILLPLLIGLVRGMMRGLVVELTAILAVVLGMIGTKLWGPQFSVWISQQFAWPEVVCTIVAYALLFLAITVSLNIIGKLISRLFKAVHLGWINRLLGAAFGCVKWAAIILLVVFCVHQLDMQFHFLKDELKQESKVYSYVAPLSEKAWESAKGKINTYSSEISTAIKPQNQSENEQE